MYLCILYIHIYLQTNELFRVQFVISTNWTFWQDIPFATWNHPALLKEKWSFNHSKRGYASFFLGV